MKTARPLVLAAALALAPAGPTIPSVRAQPSEDLTREPDAVPLAVEDVRRLAEIVRDPAPEGGLAEALARGYFAAASPGLRAYAERYELTPRRLAAAIAESPQRYRDLGGLADRLLAQDAELRAGFRALQALLPEAAFPPVWFVVGDHGAGGLARPEGVIVAAERYAERPEEVVPLVLHELAHYQQAMFQGVDRYRRLYGPEQTLLGLSLREGVADLVARLTTGGSIHPEADVYGAAHEAELWRRFRDDLHDADPGDWMFVRPTDPELPQDLGYWIGSRIAESYLERADDRERALRELLTLPEGPEAILEQSGYGERVEGAGDDAAAAIDRVVAPWVAARDFMGVVAVQRDGGEPLLRTYGLASVELEVPHRPHGIFRIGSISKQFTAAAILLLAEDGKLATSDRVSEHLPTFKPDQPITIEHLLTHTSGVPDVYSLPRFGATDGRAGTFAQVLDDLSRAELTHPPGTAFGYSNGGYSVLAAIVEGASGISYGDFLERRLFAPLGMTSTSHERPEPAVLHRVPGYDPWGRDGLAPAPPVAVAFTAGSGSLWSSAADLLAWSRALHGGRVLSQRSYAELIRDRGRAYGYGVSVFERFGRRVIGHDGRVSGYAGDLARYLDDRLTVVVLGNVQSGARDEVRRAVAAVVLGEPFEPPAERAFAAARPPEDLAELSGVYAFGPAFRVTIYADDGRLLARANEGGSSELLPTADGAWFSRMLYATVRFGRDPSGKVDRLIWGSGEGAPAGERITY